MSTLAAPIETLLADAGWRVLTHGSHVKFIEPRTSLEMDLLEAIRLYRKHLEHGTKVIAVECGSELFMNATSMLGVKDGVVLMPGARPNLSVWFAETKKAEQFLSRMGHESGTKHRHRKRGHHQGAD